MICECHSWEKIAKEMQKQIDKTQKQKIQNSNSVLSKEDFAGNVAMTPESRKYIRQKSLSKISSSSRLNEKS